MRKQMEWPFNFSLALYSTEVNCFFGLGFFCSFFWFCFFILFLGLIFRVLLIRKMVGVWEWKWEKKWERLGYGEDPGQLQSWGALLLGLWVTLAPQVLKESSWVDTDLLHLFLYLFLFKADLGYDSVCSWFGRKPGMTVGFFKNMVRTVCDSVAKLKCQ